MTCSRKLESKVETDPQIKPPDFHLFVFDIGERREILPMEPAAQELTPLDVLRSNKDSTAARKVVLLTTGSMNPIHLGHVAQLEKAKSFLAAHHKAEVVAAFVSPSDAGWSRGKQYGYISNEKKLELCRAALSDHPFVRVDAWELTQGQIDFPEVFARLQKLITAEDPKLEVLYVCGEDHAQKCHLFTRPWCIVIGRPGYSTQSKTATKAIFVPFEETETDTSSTQIRKAIATNTLETIRHKVHPRVYAILEKDGASLLRK